MENEVGYFAVINADILFNDKLTDAEKILCAHISTLQRKFGYCYASNNYFSKVTGVHKNTISKRINKIKSLGLLEVVMVYEDGSNNIDKRLMKLKEIDKPINHTVDTLKPNEVHPINHTIDTPINRTVKDNIINTNINKPNNKREGKPSSLEEVEEYFKFKKFDLKEAINFFEYYESNGWKVGKNPMKKWKLAANRWVRNARPNYQKKEPTSLAKKYFPDMFDEKQEPIKKIDFDNFDWNKIGE
jgi:hypothetical protein